MIDGQHRGIYFDPWGKPSIHSPAQLRPDMPRRGGASD